MTDKPVLAFLPGLLCDGALWRHQLAAFGDRFDCRVADFTRQDSIAAMARSALADLPERFALAGLSMGGYVAMEVMRQAPERVERLALLNTKARGDTPERTRYRLDQVALVERGDFKGVTEQLLPHFLHQERLADGPLVEEVVAMTRRVGKAVFLRQQAAILGRSPWLPVLPGIACPTLVLGSRHDALTPPDCHEEIAAAIPGADLLVVGSAGHLTTMECPERVNAALETWLVG